MDDFRLELPVTPEGSLRFPTDAYFGDHVEDHKIRHGTATNSRRRSSCSAHGFPAVLSGWCALWRHCNSALADRAAWPPSCRLFSCHKWCALARSRNDLRLRRRDRSRVSAQRRALRTTLETPRGAPLAGLWLLWVAGRVLVWSGPEPIAAIVDCAFLPVVAIVLLRVLITARNRHNIFLPVALGIFGFLNICFHWWAWHGRPDLSIRASYAAIGLVVMFVTVIAGRVVPMFTTNTIPGFRMTRWKVIETLAVPVVLLTFVADAANARPLLIVACACAAAAVHGIRVAGWHSWRVGPRPILWILHVAYAWIPIGFALLALAAAGAVPHSLAIHALTIGAIGCAIIAMITRTALGHTGRPLVAGRSEIASYCLMIAAAIMRVFGP